MVRLFDRLGRQPLVIVTLWVVAAVLAVLVGVVGIGVVGTGLTSRQGAPISEEEVLREVNGLNTTPPAASPTPSLSPVPSLSAAPSLSPPPKPVRTDSQSFPTRGGIVVASCDRIISMSPAQGFSVHEQGTREGEFRGTSDNHNRVKVELSCSGGQVQLRVRGER
jgi:hypothetical protein